MKKKLYLALFFTALIGFLYFSTSKKVKPSGGFDFQVQIIPDTALFSLRKGDILVRPNWEGMPGSCSIQNGRKYGHVAMVTEDATGKTIGEALSKASVIEALFFDQGTRKFQFDKKDQIREGKAIISFGERFKGIRYRLRVDLTVDQTEKMIQFLKNQLDGGYNILSFKKQYVSASDRESALKNMKNSNWHCATIIWEAFYLTTNIDIDANGGIFIYPADIIASKYFDLNVSRICF
jgi:hypothetical protein